MSDASTLSGLAVSSTGRDPNVYQAARQVGFRARATQSSETTGNQRALQRLDQILNSGEPLNPDAPRGFYVNILA